MRDRAHDEAMAETFWDDPAYAVQLLNSILEEGDQSELLITLRQMAKAFGGIQTVAETAHLSTTQLSSHDECSVEHPIVERLPEIRIASVEHGLPDFIEPDCVVELFRRSWDKFRAANVPR